MAANDGGNVEPMDRLIFVGIIFFTLLMVGESKWSPNDGQTFQAVCSCLSGFVGAFLARIKPSEKRLPPDTTITTSTLTVTPPEAPKP